MVDVTEASGIEFVHESGKYGDKLLPETMGSGVAVLDYNNDGHLDLLFVNACRWEWDPDNQQPSPCGLYEGDGNFHFTKVSQAGLEESFYGMGVAVGDYDNDGDSDLFVSAVGKNRLLRNDDARFVDVTDQAGVGGADNAWGTSCGFFDFDNDGLLDLFVCNYVDWSKDNDLTQNFTLDGETRAYGPPRAFAGSFSYLYRNQGNGQFEDVSESAGIQVRNETTSVPLVASKSLPTVAVPDAAENSTDTSTALVADSVTANTALVVVEAAPSTTVTSPIHRSGLTVVKLLTVGDHPGPKLLVTKQR